MGEAASISSLPSAWAIKDELRRRLAARKLAVFLDYDGTLTPIVEDYTRALLPGEMRQTIAALAERCPVAIVSGRDLAHLKDFVGLDGVLYAGSHGFDIEAPGHGHQTYEGGEAFLADLDAAEHELIDAVARIDGAAVERKRFAIAVHFRNVAEPDAARVEAAVDAVLARHDRLKKGFGKKIFELQPRLDWDKGKALGWMTETFGYDRAGVMVIYIGDDLTDENAFRVLDAADLGIVVGDDDRRTLASHRLESPDQVERFLRLLIAALDSAASS